MMPEIFEMTNQHGIFMNTNSAHIYVIHLAYTVYDMLCMIKENEIIDESRAKKLEWGPLQFAHLYPDQSVTAEHILNDAACDLCFAWTALLGIQLFFRHNYLKVYLIPWCIGQTMTIGFLLFYKMQPTICKSIRKIDSQISESGLWNHSSNLI